MKSVAKVEQKEEKNLKTCSSFGRALLNGRQAKLITVSTSALLMTRSWRDVEVMPDGA